jgi:hypothetical protein
MCCAASTSTRNAIYRCFMDAPTHAAGQEGPLEFRRKPMAKNPKHLDRGSDELSRRPVRNWAGQQRETHRTGNPTKSFQSQARADDRRRNFASRLIAASIALFSCRLKRVIIITTYGLIRSCKSRVFTQRHWAEHEIEISMDFNGDGLPGASPRHPIGARRKTSHLAISPALKISDREARNGLAFNLLARGPASCTSARHDGGRIGIVRR